MISLEGLSYTYPFCVSPALKNINLEVKEGEFVLLTGESGCGKSTLLNCLNGIIPHLCGGVLSGKIQVNGFDPRDLSISCIAREVGTVFQNPENQIFMSTVKEDIVFGCRNLGFSQDDVEKKLDISLKELGLWYLKERETDALSNGEKQRLAIAGMYAASPRLFLFDESATDLDAKGRIEFREILKNLKAKGHTIILAEHDYADYADLVDKSVVLKEGSLFVGIKD